MKNKKRLEPRIPKREGGMSFVFTKDIIELHGEEWYEKFCKIAGCNTHSVVAEEDLPQGYTIKDAWNNWYYCDYDRFANKLDYGTPTYWD